MMVNSGLSGGLYYIYGWWCNVPILKNDGFRQWVSDDIPYEMESKIHLPNHQPDDKISLSSGCSSDEKLGSPILDGLDPLSSRAHLPNHNRRGPCRIFSPI
jgi:hypothetical protein